MALMLDEPAPITGACVSSVMVSGMEEVDVPPPMLCTAEIVHAPSLVKPGSAHSPSLELDPGVDGAPASNVQVTVSEPFVAVTVTFAPGIRLLTVMYGEVTLVIVSVVTPELDPVCNATLGGPSTVHDSVELALLPARSVAEYTSECVPAVRPVKDVHVEELPSSRAHVYASEFRSLAKGPDAKVSPDCVVVVPEEMLFAKVAAGAVGATVSMRTVAGSEVGEIHSGRPLTIWVAVMDQVPSMRVPKSHDALPGVGPFSLACQR